MNLAVLFGDLETKMEHLKTIVEGTKETCVS